MPIFAFTDIEGSTGLWEKHQGGMGPIIARHYAILDELTPRFGGKTIKKTGDGIFALFPDPQPGQPCPALEWALECQRRFQGQVWPVVGELRVRMALHKGEAEEMGGDYYGPTANRTARLMALGWGGQILVSEDLRRAATLPEGAAWADLGVHQVKDLPEPQPVFGVLHPDLALRDFPALKSLSDRPHNFPEELSPFVGRERELREIAALLTRPQGRLITLLGLPGSGKSRLAVKAALEQLGAFKHGAYLVDASRGAGLVPSIAAAFKLSLYKEQDALAQVIAYLKDRSMILVLDPADSLGALDPLRAILEACPGLRLLACARRRLHLQGETVVKVGGLELPGPGGDVFAVNPCAQLFLHEAQAVLPGFAFAPDDGPALARLCRALRGSPLGLELAAGAMRTTPLKAIAERVTQEPRFLSWERPDRPAAHHSLQAQFEASWSGLNEAERKALAGLAVFSGSFTVAAAQRVLGAGTDVLSGLMEAGLLEAAGTGRFGLPEIPRLFAALKLDADPAGRDLSLDNHARYYLRLLKERERALGGYEQGKAVAELREEYANFPRAFDRGLLRAWAPDLAGAARSIGLYAGMQGLAREWEPRLERALSLWEGVRDLAVDEAQRSQSALQAALADMSFNLARNAQARERMDKSLALARKGGSKPGVAYALVRLAVFMGPEDERRRPALEEAAMLYASLSDSNGIAWARRNLGYFLCLQGRAAEGLPLLKESLETFKKVGNAREIAWSLNSMGQAALEAGDRDGGVAKLREARALFLELGDQETAGWTLIRLGRACMAAQDWMGAVRSLEESLLLFGRLRHLRGRAQSLRLLCEAWAAQGNLASAGETVDRAIAEAQAAGDLSGQAAALLQKAQLQAGQGALDAALESLEAAHTCYAKAGSESGGALVMEAQAGLWLQKGEARAARELLEQAMDRHHQREQRDGEARLAVRLGDLDAQEGKPGAGEGWYNRALKLSRLQKPGDYSLGALLGLAAIAHKQGRKLEALHLALLVERALATRMMPPSEPEFYAELGQRCEALLSSVASKLLGSVIEEARAKMAKQDARALLKEQLDKA
jgi:class 3 adenylate cyclase/tetratricopeptide (TPR) repeat protein